jgi:hypothetical protein
MLHDLAMMEFGECFATLATADARGTPPVCCACPASAACAEGASRRGTRSKPAADCVPIIRVVSSAVVQPMVSCCFWFQIRTRESGTDPRCALRTRLNYSGIGLVA